MLIFMFAEENIFIELIKYPPGSMIFIMLLSSTVAVISTGLTKLLTDTEEIQRKQKLIKKHKKRKEEIINLADINPARYQKERKQWERKDKFIQESQRGMAFSRLKPTCITFLPMIIIFAILRGIFSIQVGGTTYQLPVAMPPMNPWDVPFISDFLMASTGGETYEWTKAVYGTVRAISERNGWINFTSWYFLCSLGINTLLQRIAGIQNQASGGMEQMMGGQKASAMEFPEV
ncbi:MAG: EMC3/TMCO1 family protein [Promethearchaeia archaeon]